MNDNYNYLKTLKKETKEYIINKINNGEINLYHSCMSVLKNRFDKNNKKLSDLQEEYEYYLSRKNFSQEELVFIKELFELCYKNFCRKYKI